MTSLSVRTLHYYDEINLLKPSCRTGKGHRLYTDADLLRLQQIVTFRFLGLTLSQIKKILCVDQFEILNHLKMQANAIAEEAMRIEKISKLFNYLISQHSDHHEIEWKAVVKIIEVFQQKDVDTKQWYEKYLSDVELAQFEKYKKKRIAKWLGLFEEIKANLNADPESDIGLALVNKWIVLADEAYGKHPELRAKLWEIYRVGAIPESFFPYDKDVVLFLARAFQGCKKANRRQRKS